MLFIYLAMIDDDTQRSKFEYIYHTYYGMMYKVAYELTKDQRLAEDAVHETMVNIIEDIDTIHYTFETGKTYALVGMNGSGKTTLIKLLMRLYTPINGHIYVNGVDIEEISFSSLQQQISAVFQDFIRYPFNVAENIAIHDADNINDFERVKEAAVHSEATEFIDALPLGYRTTLEKEWNGGTELSGGQWQKIAIARCFYKSSSVVILDEPFSAIDSFSEEQIIKSLASDTINKMCIFVTHRFNNICLADQILVLKDAQLIENGTHAQLMATNGLYARLYHAQADAFFTLSQSEVQEE